MSDMSLLPRDDRHVPIAPRPMKPHDASRHADWEKHLMEVVEARIQTGRRAGLIFDVIILKS